MQVLEDLGLTTGSALDPTRRIFVNRNLRFDQITHVGFDMDYTLARYEKEAIEELSFSMTADRLVEKHGYPEEIRAIPYDSEFVIRGLVIDKRLGNIFKMDGHSHVGRVFHGRRQLDKEERRRTYRNLKIRLTARRYHWIDTLFALPEAALYAGIIDLYEQELGVKKVAYWKLFDDIRTAIDECHRDGSLKKIVKADLDKYFQVDPDLPLTLHKLRSAGKKIFVLTNSYYDYTNTVMSYLLDGKLAEYPGWRNYFDVICVGAQKPRFFTDNAPFLKVDLATGKATDEPARIFEHRGVYQHGNINLFEELFGCGGDSILYVGDHIYGDIIRSKKDSLWRTALVLEDLEKELILAKQQQRAQADLYAIEEHRALLDHEITALKVRLSGMGEDGKRQVRMLLDRKRRDLRAVIARRDILSQEVESGYNRYWGSVFKEGQEASRFGEQVEDYACIYTSQVSNFLVYSPNQYFRAPRHWMPHEKA